jgi:3-phenylpropionate/trans-cinnamate dioxygenase ferredoxin component
MTRRLLCKLADLPEGGARVFDVGGLSLAAARSGTKVFVVENRCSHDDGPLGEGRVLGGDIECPRHGARFDLATGRATRMPAVAPIATYTATIEGADVFVEVDE